MDKNVPVQTFERPWLKLQQHFLAGVTYYRNHLFRRFDEHTENQLVDKTNFDEIYSIAYLQEVTFKKLVSVIRRTNISGDLVNPIYEYRLEE